MRDNRNNEVTIDAGFINRFLLDVTMKNDGVFPIYNESSLQFEMAKYLGEKLADGYRIDVERNINGAPMLSYLNDDAIRIENPVKKELDLFVYNPFCLKERGCAIELKYPRNAAYPDVYTAFTKDIRFMEQVKEFYRIDTYCIVLASWRAFYCRNELADYRETRNGVSNAALYNFYRTKSVDMNDIIMDEAGNQAVFHDLNEWLNVVGFNYTLDDAHYIRWNQAGSEDNKVVQTDGYEKEGEWPVCFYVVRI